MTALAQSAPVPVDWPRELARRSLDHQHQAFTPSQPAARFDFTPRVDAYALWLGDASLLHDLGWWLLGTLRLSRTLLSMQYQSQAEVFEDLPTYLEVAEEAFDPLEAKFVNPYLLRAFLEARYFGANEVERAAAMQLPITSSIQTCEAALHNEVYNDMRKVLAEAQAHAHEGTFTGTNQASTLKTLAANARELVALIEKDRRRSAEYQAILRGDAGGQSG